MLQRLSILDMKEELVVDTDYDKGFYDTITAGSEQSASVLVPYYLDDLFENTIRSVVDIGCGRGVWGKEFQNQGCEVLGVDGAYVTDPVIPFMAHDLREPLILDKKYDLAVCLEVAEHLPEGSADTLIQSLVDASDIVLFSAAIPYQTGHGHINCQWPSYWARKFHSHGYVVEDYRQEHWADPRIEPWYAQNMLLFVKNELLVAEADAESLNFGVLDMVHPTIHGWGR